MNWQDMSNTERDRLLHTKVMGKPVRCPGKPETIWHKNPTRTPKQYFEYAVWQCSECGNGGTSVAPAEHDVVELVPSYCISLDAAWQLLESIPKIHFPSADVSMLQRFGVYRCSIHSTMHKGYSEASTPAEAICKAALMAVGVMNAQGEVKG